MGGENGEGKSKGKGNGNKGMSEKGDRKGGKGSRGAKGSRDKDGKGGEQRRKPTEADVFTRDMLLSVLTFIKDTESDRPRPDYALTAKTLQEFGGSSPGPEPPSTPKKDKKSLAGSFGMDPNAEAFVPGEPITVPLTPLTPGGSKRISLADHVEETPKGTKIGGAASASSALAAASSAVASPTAADYATAVAMNSMSMYYSMQQAALASVAGLSQMQHMQQQAGQQLGARWPGDGQGFTTVMLRHIPNRYTRDMLLERLDNGYKGQYDFVYLPIDFNSKCNVGYAFINFRTPPAAKKFIGEFHGVKAKLCLPGFSSKKICEVSYATVQGQEANMENFRDEKFIEKLKERPEWHPLFYDRAGKEIPLSKVLNQTAKKRRSTDNPGIAAINAATMAAQAQAAAVAAAAASPAYAAAAAAMMSPAAGAFSPFGMMASPFGMPASMGSGHAASPPVRLEGLLQGANRETLFMLKNVPTSLKREEMIQFLNKNYKGTYNFIFLPGDFHGGVVAGTGDATPTPTKSSASSNRGFVFLNFRKAKDATKFKQDFDGKPMSQCFELTAPVEGTEDPVCKIEEAKLGSLEKSIHRMQANDAKGGSTQKDWYPVLFQADGNRRNFPTLTGVAPLR